jgi:ribosomal protein L15
MTDATSTTDTAQSTELSVNDLNAMKVIIDIASSRGAFKPNEMVAVGQTYNKLETFLNAVAAQQKAQEALQAANGSQATTSQVASALATGI